MPRGRSTQRRSMQRCRGWLDRRRRLRLRRRGTGRRGRCPRGSNAQAGKARCSCGPSDPCARSAPARSAGPAGPGGSPRPRSRSRRCTGHCTPPWRAPPPPRRRLQGRARAPRCPLGRRRWQGMAGTPRPPPPASTVPPGTRRTPRLRGRCTFRERTPCTRWRWQLRTPPGRGLCSGEREVRGGQRGYEDDFLPKGGAHAHWGRGCPTLVASLALPPAPAAAHVRGDAVAVDAALAYCWARTSIRGVIKERLAVARAKRGPCMQRLPSKPGLQESHSAVGCRR